MSVMPGIWNWKDHYKGSTFTPKKIKFNRDITGATIICQMRAIQGSTVIKEWKTGLGVIVVNPLVGEIVLCHVNDFSPSVGNYIYDVRIKFQDGNGQTYLKGTLKVVQNK